LERPMGDVHRPFQPNDDFDVGRWRSVADRVVVSVLDLISYHIGTYSGDAEVWLRYRDTMRRVAREVDGVTVISVDVARLAEIERLPIGPDRLYPIPYGTEHLTGNELARVPAELLARGFHSEQFILCLGTNYSHKNRDLAIRAFLELRRRGWALALVLVGAAVPWGSSRAREDSQGVGEIFVLPELPSEERNWLFRHASLLFYPTSAEGFGLVPYEAARFGTPSVYVSFGPLGEIAGEQPVLARDWSPEALADAAEGLLRDPALASQQVEACLAAGAPYTWARTTEELVTMYRELMARPPRYPWSAGKCPSP
jgi:glycosyltransferase involved in cell wall biosynthesis